MSSSSLLLISPTTQLASEDGFWNVQTDDCWWWASFDRYTVHCQIELCYCDFFSLWEEDDSLLQLGFRFFTHLRIGISGSLFWIPQFYLFQWEEILNVTASMKVSDLQPWRHLDPQPISQHHEEEKASGPAANRPASWGRRKQNPTLKEKVKKTTKTQLSEEQVSLRFNSSSSNMYAIDHLLQHHHWLGSSLQWLEVDEENRVLEKKNPKKKKKKQGL